MLSIGDRRVEESSVQFFSFPIFVLHNNMNNALILQYVNTYTIYEYKSQKIMFRLVVYIDLYFSTVV